MTVPTLEIESKAQQSKAKQSTLVPSVPQDIFIRSKLSKIKKETLSFPRDSISRTTRPAVWPSSTSNVINTGVILCGSK
ncbi:hypothetical protein CUMW_023800 [Citrus unshiu]|nr:hypothetical protein CUMW_023800 [Citrus unshiu]GAY36687.1 hypothetical protein CUMW_023800 [Citrus unshiu]GAY36688.1 hypothetical protein CUMW_023800 [Citrus unshiu]